MDFYNNIKQFFYDNTDPLNSYTNYSALKINLLTIPNNEIKLDELYNIISCNFKLPITYLKDKYLLNLTIFDDIDLLNDYENSRTSLYNYIFFPSNYFAKNIANLWCFYYTDNVEFLKQSQLIYTQYKSSSLTEPANSMNETEIETNLSCEDYQGSSNIHESLRNNKVNYNKFLNLWYSYKNDDSFRLKFLYFDTPVLYSLNESKKFLVILSGINITQPLISLGLPLLIFILPYFILKKQNKEISLTNYLNLLQIFLKNHAIGKLLFNYHNASLNEKFSLLLSLLFYFYQVYTNFKTCFTYYTNVNLIQNNLFEIKNYLSTTIYSIQNFIDFVQKHNLNLYYDFIDDSSKYLNILSEYLLSLSQINSNYININIFNLLNFYKYSYLLELFYKFRYDITINEAFIYSFYFNGYIQNITNLNYLYVNKYISICKYDLNLKNSFTDSYFPTLTYSNPIKNSINLTTNLIITGPNAAGKTTLLKTVLFNTIINQQIGMGFYADCNQVPYQFIHSYLNIPDTSERDSLFQSEARRCKNIIDSININKDSNHFCIFDELYSGTNPKDAITSAYSFLMYLNKFPNVNYLLTTHYTQLCKKFKNNKKIINKHMKIHHKDDKVIYKYKLINGICKYRGGLDVLKNLDYPDDILNNIK